MIQSIEIKLNLLMDSGYIKEKCDYCGEEKMVSIVQSGFTLKGDNSGLNLENKIRDFINGGKRKNSPIQIPFLCRECLSKILKILRD